jgi:hypothetical protein
MDSMDAMDLLTADCVVLKKDAVAVKFLNSADLIKI